MPQDALEFLSVDTLNMHAIKSSRHFPSVLAYYQLGTFYIARKRICDSMTVNLAVQDSFNALSCSRNLLWTE